MEFGFKMKQPPLNILQQWMQSVIEHPGSDTDAWTSDSAQASMPFDDAVANILPSKTLTSIERIAIYRRMFFLRMTESMAIDYPGVKNHVGDEEFDWLIVEEYVPKYHSRSYTLNHLGRYFPQFINESNLANKEFLFDLARLELAITNNMDAEEVAVLKQNEIASIPEEKWEHAVLVPIAALELLTFSHNVCKYLDAVIEEEKAPPVQKTSVYCVVYRSDYRTYWKELEEHEYILLSEICHRRTIGESLQILSDRYPDSAERLQQKIFQWFGEWIRNGYFSKIILPSQ